MSLPLWRPIKDTLNQENYKSYTLSLFGEDGQYCIIADLKQWGEYTISIFVLLDW